ncbi:MAG: hypothetical protein IH987_11260 [Planctomycetes bacterium]|nr:hypothetical protein [Planctomycetota bacterium]
MNRLFSMLLVLGFAFVSRANAAVVVSFEARDMSGVSIAGPVSEGSTLFVDILLSIDDSEGAVIEDLRSIQLNISETTSGLSIEGITWLVGPVYSFQQNTPPTFYAGTLLSVSSAELLILDTVPVAVATIELVANATGTLDVLGNPQDGDDFIGRVYVGFEAPIFENLVGGPLAINVSGDGGPSNGNNNGSGEVDRDGDGVPDDQDMFPDDPDESVDSDNDGVGDNADVFPDDSSETSDADNDGTGDNADEDDDNDGTPDDEDAFPFDSTETDDVDGNGIGDNEDAAGPVGGGPACGFGMIGSFLLMFVSLGFVRLQRRVRAREID